MNKYPAMNREDFEELVAKVKTKLTGDFLPKRMVIDEYKYSLFFIDEIWLNWCLPQYYQFRLLKALANMKKKLYLYITNPTLVYRDSGELVDVPLMVFDANTTTSDGICSYLNINNEEGAIREFVVVSDDLSFIIFSTRSYWESCVCYIKEKELFNFIVEEMAPWINDLCPVDSQGNKIISTETPSTYYLQFAKTHWDEFPFLPEKEMQDFLRKIRIAK